MGYVHELEKKLKENEHLIEEYQMKKKESKERHEQKVGELESLKIKGEEKYFTE